MKFWRKAAALLTVFYPQTTHTGNHSSHKDVKNEGRSDYVYENKARATKCHAKNAVFYTKIYPSHDNRQQSSGPFGRSCTNFATIRGELTPATGVALLENLCIGGAEDPFRLIISVMKATCTIPKRSGQYTSLDIIADKVGRPRQVLARRSSALM